MNVSFIPNLLSIGKNGYFMYVKQTIVKIMTICTVKKKTLLRIFMLFVAVSRACITVLG